MAEIKSTLDLVMERTKHLSMSAEERAGQQKQAFEKKLNGLLQQYEDKALAVDELVEKVTELQADLNIDGAMSALTAVVQRMQPGLDNAHWLSLVRLMAPDVCTHLEKALSDFSDRVSTLSRKGEQRFLENLARDHGIHGTAVVPSLKKDASFQDKLSVLRREALDRIGALLQQQG